MIFTSFIGTNYSKKALSDVLNVLNVLNVPNVKFLAHLAHQTQK